MLWHWAVNGRDPTKCRVKLDNFKDPIACWVCYVHIEWSIHVPIYHIYIIIINYIYISYVVWYPHMFLVYLNLCFFHLLHCIKRYGHIFSTLVTQFNWINPTQQRAGGRDGRDGRDEVHSKPSPCGAAEPVERREGLWHHLDGRSLRHWEVQEAKPWCRCDAWRAPGVNTLW